ncbi:thioredoxin family protein [Aliiruegeria sabulilitoris]|uniref:thioredoxin family protein n=1 Tax=Aliiruegeria sabulilitoris TaxID=1510458 RepID=UPI0008297DD5|nr:thioredoxin family protein [Aliiruegeria sabulilitoris]NDR58085.1 thioredoxin family protein [Pseudoruegeria sp. M32A2M]
MPQIAKLLRPAVAGIVFAFAALPAWALELVMVQQAGCHYCARWNAEIGPIYPKTAEGAHAPLRRVELGGKEMKKLTLQRRVNFTPTFVLVDTAGVEISRLEGYPGEDFFWGLLERMLLEKTDYSAPSTDGS